jgi:hypothetical protein
MHARVHDVNPSLESERVWVHFAHLLPFQFAILHVFFSQCLTLNSAQLVRKTVTHNNTYAPMRQPFVHMYLDVEFSRFCGYGPST